MQSDDALYGPHAPIRRLQFEDTEGARNRKARNQKARSPTTQRGSRPVVEKIA
jgi:hypothetical protein